MTMKNDHEYHMLYKVLFKCVNSNRVKSKTVYNYISLLIHQTIKQSTLIDIRCELSKELLIVTFTLVRIARETIITTIIEFNLIFLLLSQGIEYISIVQSLC